jgi:hypothetical protein
VKIDWYSKKTLGVLALIISLGCIGLVALLVLGPYFVSKSRECSSTPGTVTSLCWEGGNFHLLYSPPQLTFK